MPTLDNLRDQIAAAIASWPDDARWLTDPECWALADAVLPLVQAAIAEARREALLSAADDWERIGRTEDSRREMDAFAREHYTPGGPSMPTLWLRARAAGEHDTETTMEDWSETDEILADPVTLDLIEQGEADLAGGTTPTAEPAAHAHAEADGDAWADDGGYGDDADVPPHEFSGFRTCIAPVGDDTCGLPAGHPVHQPATAEPPCCNDDFDDDLRPVKCPGMMRLVSGGLEYVCDTCRGRCGRDAHPRCISAQYDAPPQRPQPATSSGDTETAAPCGAYCPGECGHDPTDPDDPCSSGDTEPAADPWARPPASLKMLAEDLCRHQARDGWPQDIAASIADLLELIKWHRPLGPNGKHGDRHTATCGCEDISCSSSAKPTTPPPTPPAQQPDGPCGVYCPGDCGHDPADPNDPCAVQTAEHEIDTAAIRANWASMPMTANGIINALCDALDRQREETARLRESLAKPRPGPINAGVLAQRDDARARLDEARALCDEVERDYGKGTDFDIHGCAMISVRRLRAILDRPPHQGAARAEPQA